MFITAEEARNLNCFKKYSEVSYLLSKSINKNILKMISDDIRLKARMHNEIIYKVTLYYHIICENSIEYKLRELYKKDQLSELMYILKKEGFKVKLKKQNYLFFFSLESISFEISW